MPWADLAVPVAVLSIVLAMIVPLPAPVLDALIAANITLSVLVLLIGMYITRPVEFSVYPTTLLLMTLFRLAQHQFIATHSARGKSRHGGRRGMSSRPSAIS